MGKGTFSARATGGGLGGRIDGVRGGTAEDVARLRAAGGRRSRITGTVTGGSVRVERQGNRNVIVQRLNLGVGNVDMSRAALVNVARQLNRGNPALIQVTDRAGNRSEVVVQSTPQTRRQVNTVSRQLFRGQRRLVQQGRQPGSRVLASSGRPTG